LLTSTHWQDNTTNVDRSINALELLTVEVTKPEYEGIVKSIEVINEPFLDTGKEGGATFEQLADYYVRSYKSIRAKETILDGAAPVTVIIHDAFQPVLNVRRHQPSTAPSLLWLIVASCSGASSSATPPLEAPGQTSLWTSVRLSIIWLAMISLLSLTLVSLAHTSDRYQAFNGDDQMTHE
jgi:hypothetical protein